MTTPTTQDRQDAQREPLPYNNATGKLIENAQLTTDSESTVWQSELKKKTPFTPAQLWPIVNQFFGKDMEIYYEFARAIERAHGIGE